MQIKSGNHSIDSLFSFLLLLIFCLFTLMLAGMGSTIYRNGAAYLDENYTSRTAAAYISEKVRQHDEAGAVFMTSVRETTEAGGTQDTDISRADGSQAAVSESAETDSTQIAASKSAGTGGTQAAVSESAGAGEIPALGFLDEIEGNFYVTYVYFYDGALCELMIQKDRTPEAAMGNRIVKLSFLSIEEVIGKDMLSVTAASDEGNELSVLIHVSCGLEDRAPTEG